MPGVRLGDVVDGHAGARRRRRGARLDALARDPPGRCRPPGRDLRRRHASTPVPPAREHGQDRAGRGAAERQHGDREAGVVGLEYRSSVRSESRILTRLGFTPAPDGARHGGADHSRRARDRRRELRLVRLLDRTSRR